MLIGYARVSTYEQNLDLQLEALKEAGCKRIYEDQISGLRSDRPGLQGSLDQLREGDIFVVWKLDRLGRSVKGLIEFVAQLEERKVHFKSLTDNIDTSTTMGRFFFHVMASLAQMGGLARNPRNYVVAPGEPQYERHSEEGIFKGYCF